MEGDSTIAAAIGGSDDPIQNKLGREAQLLQGAMPFVGQGVADRTRQAADNKGFTAAEVQGAALAGMALSGISPTASRVASAIVPIAGTAYGVWKIGGPVADVWQSGGNLSGAQEQLGANIGGTLVDAALILPAALLTKGVFGVRRSPITALAGQELPTGVLGDMTAVGDMSVALKGAKDTAIRVTTPFGTGSGFHLGEGYFATADHVVAGTVKNGATSVQIDSPVRFFGSSAKIVYRDQPRDLAVLKAYSWDNQAAAALAETGVRGESVVGAGFPGGKNYVVSPGTILRVSGVGKSTTGFITDQVVESGQSGGAVFNRSGEVVGMIQKSSTKSPIYTLVNKVLFRRPNTAVIRSSNDMESLLPNAKLAATQQEAQDALAKVQAFGLRQGLNLPTTKLGRYVTVIDRSKLTADNNEVVNELIRLDPSLQTKWTQELSRSGA